MTTSATDLIAEAQQAMRNPGGTDAAIPLPERPSSSSPRAATPTSRWPTSTTREGWLRRELALWLGRFDLEPNDPDACERIGWVLWFMGHARDAVPWLERGRSISRLAAADWARTSFPAPSSDDAEVLDAADPTPVPSLTLCAPTAQDWGRVRPSRRASVVRQPHGTRPRRGFMPTAMKRPPVVRNAHVVERAANGVFPTPMLPRCLPPLSRASAATSRSRRTEPRWRWRRPRNSRRSRLAWTPRPLLDPSSREREAESPNATCERTHRS